MKLLAVILFALLRLVEHGANDSAHRYDPTDAVAVDSIMLWDTVWGPAEEELLKPVYLGGGCWRFERTGEYYSIWPGRWWITRVVVYEWMSNRTLCVSGNRIETRLYR